MSNQKIHLVSDYSGPHGSINPEFAEPPTTRFIAVTAPKVRSMFSSHYAGQPVHLGSRPGLRFVFQSNVYLIFSVFDSLETITFIDEMNPEELLFAAYTELEGAVYVDDIVLVTHPKTLTVPNPNQKIGYKSTSKQDHN